MRRKLAIGATASIVTMFLLTVPAAAQEDGTDLQPIIDNMWVFIAGIMVFLMQAGFGLVEAGMTRAKNVANIMAKNLADMSIGVIAFWAVGFGFAYGADSGNIIGTDGFFLSGAPIGIDGGLSIWTDFFFQVVFAATAVTIASGAMAERTKFSGYLIFSALMTAFIYPVVVHWFWGGGLIAKMEVGDAVFSDFAGSTIVHSTGGWAALMGAYFLGPRIGKYDENGNPRAIPGHNMAYTIIGVFILWFGWFGFNPGSQLGMDEVVARAGVTTLLAAAAGGLSAGAVVWLKTGRMEVGMAGNGVLAGLVSITAGTAAMNTMGAFVTGLIGGAIVVFAVLFIDRIGIDDPVGAISVHGICGVWGTLAVGLFAVYDDGFLGRAEAGLFYGGGIEQLLVQLFGALIVFAFVVVAAGIVFFTLKKLNLLRVTPEEEMQGLDVMEHGSPGYNNDTVTVGSHGIPETAPNTKLRL
ncbi:MAG: ammonium transporter [Acidimicrobiales bacterium]